MKKRLTKLFWSGLLVFFNMTLICAEAESPLNTGVALTPKLVAVGNYLDTQGVSHGGIAVSADQGLTWIQQVLPIQDGFVQERLNANSCVGSRCVAVGASLESLGRNGTSLPLVRVSEDAGTKWTTQTLERPTLPQGASTGAFEEVSCVDNQCVAVGRYRITQVRRNHLGTALSNDGGKTWVQQVLPPPNNFPVFDAILRGISCRQSGCVAVGSYLGKVNPEQFHSVFAITTNKTFWEQTVQQSPEGMSQQLNAVDCPHDGLCIAVGGKTARPKHLPKSSRSVLVAARIVPTSGFAKFVELPIPSQIVNDPDCQLAGQTDISLAELSAVKCEDTRTCVAVGQYQCRATSPPLFFYDVLAKTMNGGITWMQIVSKKYNSAESFPSNSEVLCMGNTCVKIGSTMVSLQPVAPLVNRTTNGGRTWVQTVLPIPQVPFKIQSAELKGLSSTMG